MVASPQGVGVGLKPSSGAFGRREQRAAGARYPGGSFPNPWRFNTVATGTADLLQTLDSAIQEKVWPFFSALNAQHLIGESCFDRGAGPASLKHRRHMELEGRFFWWINRFIADGTTFEIGYGDREAIIETRLFFAAIRKRFEPWELLSAAQVTDPHAVTGQDRVLTPGSMTGIIAHIADGIREHWHILAKPTFELIERALVLRGKRLQQAQEEQRRRDRERASANASAAFHAGRFAEAIRPLEPFKSDAELSRSSAMMIELAERRLK